MPRLLVCLVTMIAWSLGAEAPLAAEAEKVASLKTAGDAVLCLTADMLTQAVEAAKEKDRQLMEQLGCFPIFADVPARRIDTKRSSAIWQVELKPKGGEPLTAWGYNDAFRSEAGERLDKDGRPLKPEK